MLKEKHIPGSWRGCFVEDLEEVNYQILNRRKERQLFYDVKLRLLNLKEITSCYKENDRFERKCSRIYDQSVLDMGHFFLTKHSI